MGNKPNSVRSVVRALQILEQFTADQVSLTLTEIAEATELSKATVLRLAYTLEEFGFLSRDDVDKKYRLGNKLFYLGSLVSNQMELRKLAIPVMERLRSLTGETIHLNVKEGNERICLEEIESIHDLRTVVKVGQRSPLYAGASAKLLLAFQDDNEVDRVLKQSSIKNITDNTIIDVGNLRKEIEHIREEGYAYSFAERIVGAVSISVPIFDYTGKLVAGLSVAYPEARHSKETKELYLKELRRGVEDISLELGYRPQNINKKY